MEERGNMIEVLGVPDVLPHDDWTIDKLLIHFLRAKHGGGEVLKVLYPCYQPGQAFIVFEKPEVAARVLQRPHVLELKDQQHKLTVKAANDVGMDFTVEATLHLKMFPNKRQVKEILQSHDFRMVDVGVDQLRVKGSFLKLRAAKATLEKLLNSGTETDVTSSSSSPGSNVSSGAIPKKGTNSLDRNRGREGSRREPPHASPSSPTTSSSRGSSSSNHHSKPDRRDTLDESFVVDADVYEYAKRLRKKDIDIILYSLRVTKEERQIGDSCKVTFRGRGAVTAAGKLQSFLNDLSTSLRTQEVSLQDLDHEGKALLEGIQKNKNIYGSVLVCERNDKLHLIGMSAESFEVKQKLLVKQLDQSGRTGRTGRTSDKSSRKKRSSSLPPVNQKGRERDAGAMNSSPDGAAGYSPSRYQDDKQEAAATLDIPRRRSLSESRQKHQTERTDDNVQDMKNNPASKLPKKGLQKLLQFDPSNIKNTFKKRKK